MKALLEPIKEIARFDELFRDLKKGTAGVTVISGCLESQKAHMIAGLSEDAPVRLLIAENELKAKELYEDFNDLHKSRGIKEVQKQVGLSLLHDQGKTRELSL